MKKAIPWIVVAVILLIGGYAVGRYKVNAAVAEAKAQAEQEKAQALAGQIKDLFVQIDKRDAAFAKLESDSAANQRAIIAQLGKVQTATPQQLVDQGSQISQASDITTDGKTVTMGVGTYRFFVAAAVEDRDFKDVERPAWLKEKGLLLDQISDYKQAKLLDAQHDAAIADSVKDLKQFITSQKTASTLEKVLWAGAGIGAGLLAGHFLK